MRGASLRRVVESPRRTLGTPSRADGKSARGWMHSAWAAVLVRTANQYRECGDNVRMSHTPCADQWMHCALHVPLRRMKVPKLSTEEVLVGVFCIALGGLFLSFAI